MSLCSLHIPSIMFIFLLKVKSIFNLNFVFFFCEIPKRYTNKQQLHCVVVCTYNMPVCSISHLNAACLFDCCHNIHCHSKLHETATWMPHRHHIIYKFDLCFLATAKRNEKKNGKNFGKRQVTYKCDTSYNHAYTVMCLHKKTNQRE